MGFSIAKNGSPPPPPHHHHHQAAHFGGPQRLPKIILTTGVFESQGGYYSKTRVGSKLPTSMVRKEEKERIQRMKQRLKEKNEESASKPATHPCGCLKVDGSAMMLDECMAGTSLCRQRNSRGWVCGEPFPRQHIRPGDASSRLFVNCFKHRMAQMSSPESIARTRAAAAVSDKMKRHTVKESERQIKKKAKQCGRPVPSGDLRELLRRLRHKFAAILAKSAHGKLFAGTMKTIDRFLEMPVNERPNDCAVACFDVELMSSDGETGLPVWTGLFQVGTAMHARSS